jgi:hypothetical protein
MLKYTCIYKFLEENSLTGKDIEWYFKENKHLQLLSDMEGIIYGVKLRPECVEKKELEKELKSVEA